MRDGTIVSIWFTQPDHITITESYSVGSGRRRRRQLARWRTIPRVPSETPSDVLRRVADELESPRPGSGMRRV